MVRVSPERVRGDAETVQVSPERVRCVGVRLERSVAPNGDATRSARAFERPRDERAKASPLRVVRRVVAQVVRRVVVVPAVV